MKAVVLSKALDTNYDDEVAAVRFEYLVDGGPDSEVIEILMGVNEAEKYKLGTEVTLLRK